MKDSLNTFNTIIYEGKSYYCVNSFIEELLHDCNCTIINIDMGKLPNNRENRNPIEWKLNKIHKYTMMDDYKKFRSMCNSLYSNLYRLEHTEGNPHPYLKTLRDKMMKIYKESVLV